MAFAITVAGEELVLLPQKSAYWPRKRTLFIADPHWGKAAAFRAAGVGLSADPLAADLQRLSLCLETTSATRLVILGDLFHARQGKSPRVLQMVSDWKNKHRSIDVLLIRGNHDRGAGDPPEEWQFDCHAEPVLESPFAFRHFPGETEGHYTLAGHLHPAVALRGPGREQLRVPCFHFGAECGVLPAFGGFTGTATISPVLGDRVFVVADGEVMEIA